jgi:hypothetical protein
MKTLSLLTLTFLLSCNSLSGHIEQQVDSKVETAKEDMNAEIRKAKENFTAQYLAAIGQQSDSLTMYKLRQLNFSISTADKYLDSMKREMDELDVKDVNNTELVKITFLYRGAADSIINKMKNAIAAAQQAAKTEQQRLAIRAASDSLFSQPDDKWKENLFGINNSLGASMIIYGLQTELYTMGMKATTDK